MSQDTGLTVHHQEAWAQRASQNTAKYLWPILCFHLTYILFLLMPTVVKIQPLNIFNNNIQRRPQDGDITPSEYLYWCVVFFPMYMSLSLYMSYFLLQWYSHLLSLSLTFILILLPLWPSLALLEKYNEYFYYPYFKY